MANWEEISIQLENIMVENMDSMITEAPTKDLLIFMGLVRGVCENRFHGKHFVNIPNHTGAINSLTHRKNRKMHAKNIDSNATRKTRTL